jgi:hypothetical protein
MQKEVPAIDHFVQPSPWHFFWAEDVCTIVGSLFIDAML